MGDKEHIIVSTEKDLGAAIKRQLAEILPELINELKDTENDWIKPDEAMDLLNIRSKSHFWSIKSQNLIRVSKMSRKVELISKSSCLEYIEKHAKSI